MNKEDKADSIICPYCNYNFDEDKPDISWETEEYMIKSKIKVPQGSIQIFDEADSYYQCQLGSIEVGCYRCNKIFKVHREIVYWSEK